MRQGGPWSYLNLLCQTFNDFRREILPSLRSGWGGGMEADGGVEEEEGRTGAGMQVKKIQ